MRELYGEDAALRLERAPGGGAEAVLELPFHTEPVGGTAGAAARAAAGGAPRPAAPGGTADPTGARR